MGIFDLFKPKRSSSEGLSMKGKMAGVLIFESDSKGELASQFYDNLNLFIAKNKPGFPLTIHCSAGAVEERASADGWVWSIFKEQDEAEFDSFFSKFQDSDFYKPRGEYWSAGSPRMEKYSQALHSGKMRILKERR